MCGILGSLNHIFGNDALDLLKHRGPDSGGLDTFSVNGVDILMGHRRLSILDLTSAGNQPMTSNCGNYCIIFNGEVYNHLELRKELPETLVYKGHSDTETLLNYLIAFGTAGLKNFNGIFSIAFLNKVERKLILARDPFGVKPLYYHKTPDSLIFSSEIRPIKHILSDMTLNTSALASLLRLRYNPAPETLYNEICKVHPGHFLEIDITLENLKLKSCSFLTPTPRTQFLQYNRAITEYGRKIEQAVKSQLLSDVDIGVFLSGGIDSAIVAALAQKYYNGKLKAFTIGFEGNFQEDEIEHAAETSELLGIDHYYRKVSFQDFLSVMKECTRIVEEPLATTSLIPMYFLSELASKYVKVALTGQGADEPLGGYTRYKAELIGQKLPPFLKKMVLPAVLLTRIKNESIMRGANALGIKNDVERFLMLYQIFNAVEVEKLIGVKDTLSIKSLEYYYTLLECNYKSNTVERMMSLDTHLNLSDDLLTYTDKITMNFSLECRVPMLDLDLVNFIESLPVSFKLNLRKNKLIHKVYAMKLLPPEVINRKKIGFQSPTNFWFRKESELIKEILLKEGNYFSTIFNLNYINEIIEQHKSGINKEKQIFLLLSIYFTLDVF